MASLAEQYRRNDEKMTIDLVTRRQELSKEVEKISQSINELQASLQQATQARERMIGGLLMLDELMQTPGEPPPTGSGEDA